MDVMEAIRKRCSVRSYLDRSIEEEKLRLILEAARLAPSASNRQEWRFVVITDKKTRSRLMEAAKNQAFVAEAPVVLACCAQDINYKMSCGQLSYPIDVAIAIDHMTLKATEEGLGTCWVGAFYEDEVKEILGMPEEVRVVELLTIGYAKGPIKREKQRLGMDEIVMYERWGKR